jgi:hypothetical protein
VSEQLSRVQRVLDDVLYWLPRSNVTESRSVEVEDSCAEGQDTIVVKYRFPGIPCTVGLRRHIEPDVTDEEVVEEIVNFEIGEPLGTWFDPSQVVDGVFWWDGGPPERHSYNWGKPGPSRLRTWISKHRRRVG